VAKLTEEGGARLRKVREPDPAIPQAVFHEPNTGTEPNAGISLPQLPTPYEPVGDSQALTGKERADLAQCETAIDHLRISFAVAGKALQVIRDAKLYRETHGTFEDYCQDRWQMGRAYAYRLIAAWPIVEALSPMGDKINERQMRALLPLADRHGDDAAVTVYKAVADTAPKVTAAVIEGAIAVLPKDHFDEDEAIEQIRAYLEGDPQPAPPADPGERLQQARTGLHRLQRMIKPEVIRAAGPAAAKEFAGELRALADLLEAEED
jgi:hypothetical protein